MSAYDRRSISVYKGYIGERLAEKYLQKKGFEIISYMILRHYIIQPTSLITPIREMCERVIDSKMQKFRKLLNALKKISDGKEHKRRRFDFIAKKENKHYVVEVKSNGSRLSELQKKELEIAKRMGFTPIIIRTNITLIANLDNVTMELL